ncbi:hypothetical protein LCGC14_3094590, partial [marine sediment metagenome]
MMVAAGDDLPVGRWFVQSIPVLKSWSPEWKMAINAEEETPPQTALEQTTDTLSPAPDDRGQHEHCHRHSTRTRATRSGPFPP